MTTTAQLFGASIAQAMTLSPEEIEDTIRDTAGGWPGGGGGEPVSGGGMSDPTSATVIRRLSSPNPDHDLADIDKLQRARDGFVASVACIAAKCSSAPAPDDWEDAVKVGHLLQEQDLVVMALEVGIAVTRDVFRLHDFVTTVQRIHDGHCAHTADDTAKLATGDPICLSHARIGDYDRPRHRGHRVCRTCHDLIAQIGNPAELDNDPDAWPPVDLLREHAHMEITGKRADYHRARQLWIERQGPRAASA